ncbi:PAS domain-containing sensor histidine kinase [Hymenobacter weizhouensis]|uniref:PAS domain-containing sensor histidine kinase n=1 Tax=Hymenobacter sp. YIM 151500-1 TaxID=2987689 RepID=UPI002225DBC0|nr:PAS domain-containing sensor histidine kinase [Hymenobacter sp. YIM 151500-1]UYZ64467.1 PAS domain-containing sensor histidine kinase [Hymenobacter sp. YIM 151500-1]
MIPASPAPAASPPYSFPDGLLPDLLEVSLTAVNLLRPVYGGANGGEIVDFHLDYLNPAAQRMAGLPEQPGTTALTRFPEMTASGVIDFYRRTFQSGATGLYEVNYQADGLDNYFRLAARRSGELLLVSFTDTSDQPRTAVEEALRESQAREKQARAEAEAERQRLHQVLMQLPAQVTTNRGPDHVFELINPRFEQLVAGRLLHGRSAREALPELEGQQFFELFDHVYQTGEPFYGREMPARVDYTSSGQLEVRYFDVFYQALRDAQGRIDGLLNFAYDVTEQVLARQQLEQLNQELEARVQERTRQLEAALRDAERQWAELSTIFEQAPVAIAILEGPDHVVRLANQGLLDLWNKTAPQVLNQPIFEAVPETRDSGFEELLARVLRTGEPLRLQEVSARLTRHGQRAPVYANVMYQPWRNPQGQVTGVIAVVADVTEQVHARRQAEALQAEVAAAAERRVQERETLYQVFEQTPAAICIQRGPAHRYEYANAAYRTLFANRPLVGLPLTEALPEVAAQGFATLLDQVYETGVTYFGTEVPLVFGAAADTPERTTYFSFTYQALRENGQTVGISTFAYDVTEQVRARQEREVQQRRLYALFEQAPAGICIHAGPNLVYEFINPSYQRLLPGRALLGRPLFEALPELVGTDVEALLRHAYATGETHQVQDLLIPVARAEGEGELEDRYFTFVYQARRDEHGQVNAIVNFVFEVTEQVRARRQVQDLNEELAAINEELTATNEELQEANRQLQRTNVDLDNFIYTASHDLKAPITNIEGLLLALQHELPAASRVGDVPQMLQLMQEAVERFKRTIAHLTDVSRLQKEYNPPLAQVALAAVIEEVRLDLTPLLLATQARLEVDVPADCRLIFSEKNLRSVVYNLLSNALKYRHPDRVPRVHIRCRAEAGYQVLQVQDNGLGLDLAHGQEQLFQLFQRLHTHVEGTGIGLYMVKRMVENAGGHITVQSQLGQGSTFAVYFPRQPSPVP